MKPLMCELCGENEVIVEGSWCNECNKEMTEMVRKDLERPVCKWTESDKVAYSELWGYQPSCNCKECKGN